MGERWSGKRPKKISSDRHPLNSEMIECLNGVRTGVLSSQKRGKVEQKWSKNAEISWKSPPGPKNRVSEKRHFERPGARKVVFQKPCFTDSRADFP